MSFEQGDGALGNICIAVAWYRLEQWEILRRISADGEQLEDTYEEWETGAEKYLKDIAGLGIKAKKVPIDVLEWAQWCGEKKLPLDSSSRSHYAAHLSQSREGKIQMDQALKDSRSEKKSG